MHLDQVTFADTVFDAFKTNSFLVEFYADWYLFRNTFLKFLGVVIVAHLLHFFENLLKLYKTGLQLYEWL